MPFVANADLPQRIRSRYPSEAARTAFRRSFNAAFDGTCRDGGEQGDRESCSFAVASTAASRVTRSEERMTTEKSGIARMLEGLAVILRGKGEGGDLVLENAGEKVALSRIVPIVKIDLERRLVASVVYEPEVADAHGDGMSLSEIEKSCHGFGIRYGQGRGEMGTDHAEKASRLAIVPVETFLAPVDFDLGDQHVKKGSWVMWSKVLDDRLWKDVKDGVYTGYSFEGWGTRVLDPAIS